MSEQLQSKIQDARNRRQPEFLATPASGAFCDRAINRTVSTQVAKESRPPQLPVGTHIKNNHTVRPRIGSKIAQL
jgi:hypothetical protein